MAAAENIFALDPAHPNALRWQRAVDTAAQRGEFVTDLLAVELPLPSARVLDLGCGVGGTSRALRLRGAESISADIDSRRLRYLRRSDPEGLPSCLDAAAIPFRSGSFQAVALQDVIEHTADPGGLLREIRRVLAPGGILYVSTPNRWSLINLAADPHWGLPLVACFRRRTVRFIVHTLLRRDPDRTDFAELLSLARLGALLAREGFDLRLHQRDAARELFERPGRIVWSGLHRAAVSLACALGLRGAVERCVTDAPGLFNRWIAPTWYCICRAV